MKQLVILSGKGGTGKTSVVAALADLFSTRKPAARIVIVDADVDAANLDLVLAHQIITREPFFGGSTAIIDQDHCEECGICQDICRFDAITNLDQQYRIDPLACDGCAACVYQCPEIAISMQEQLAGEGYRSDSQYGILFHAHLNAAQENSGKLVALIKQQAQEVFDQGEHDLILVDGPPGIGCPVISAVSGADAALIVTEPTLAGVHDLCRVLETTNHFDIKSFVCINKADIYPDGTARINQICAELQVEILGEIPFDLEVPRAIIQGSPVTKNSPKSSASIAIRKIWAQIDQEVRKKPLSMKPDGKVKIQ